jgi:hypothetical protein
MGMRTRMGRSRRSRWWALGLAVFLALGLGQWVAGVSAIAPPLPPPDPNGLTDRTLPAQELGQEVYRNRCGTCHIALPPAVLPIESWRQQLITQEHYGQTLPPLSGIDRQLIWQYLQSGARPLLSGETEPYRVASSRYFRALHPRVPGAAGANVASCVTCHPRAEFFNFRQLTAEWDDAP